MFAQSDAMNEQLQLLKEGIFGPSSWEPILVACIVIAVGTCVVLLASRRQRRVKGEVVPNDPRKLFHSLLDRMEFDGPDRRLLESAAKELKLQNPAVILLAPATFDRSMAEYMQRTAAGATNATATASLRRMRARLFPG